VKIGSPYSFDMIFFKSFIFYINYLILSLRCNLSKYSGITQNQKLLYVLNTRYFSFCIHKGQDTIEGFQKRRRQQIQKNCALQTS